MTGRTTKRALRTVAQAFNQGRKRVELALKMFPHPASPHASDQTRLGSTGVDPATYILAGRVDALTEELAALKRRLANTDHPGLD